jgi:predicted nucleic acid-binding protein
LDSSALVKRYIHENGSPHVDRLLREADAVMVSALCFPEVISSFSRRRREKKMNADEYDLYKGYLLEDIAAFEICQLTPEVLLTTVNILERSDLRASDAIHVASAVQVKAERFVSGDTRQITAAKAFKLNAEAV